jgi:hypothetical protein
VTGSCEHGEENSRKEKGISREVEPYLLMILFHGLNCTLNSATIEERYRIRQTY